MRAERPRRMGKTTDSAISAAREAIRAFNTRDPFRIAEEKGITVLPREGFKLQKGAFTVILGSPFIILNSNLCEEEIKIVCAHELGHALLHADAAQNGALCEFDLFNMATSMEYEANVFASELLIDDRELKELLASGADVYSAAKALNVCVNLLLIKLAEKNRRGGKYRLPYLPDKGFMGGK